MAETNRTITIPDALTEDDVWLVEQMIAKLAAIRADAAEWARRDGEKTEQLMKLIHKEIVL